MTFDQSLLTLLIFIPIAGGILTLFVPTILARPVAFLVSLISLGLCVPLYKGFNASLPALFNPTKPSALFEVKLPWIDSLHVNYHLGIDGIALPLVILTAFITVLVILSAWRVIQYKPKQYLAAFLIMEGIMIGVFCALDAILFYLFWEAMLIPMFLIIGVWGGPRRVYATTKFFLYTFMGSVFMLVALIYLYNKSPAGKESFSILSFYHLNLNPTEQFFIFIAFLLAFAVKVPMWPVHTWLPDAHVEAPTGGSVILAAIMLKIGGYGFLRFSLPITPLASLDLAWFMILLSLIAIFYIGFVALVQQDMKKLIAYSSIAHMGFVTLGFFIVFALIKFNIANPEVLKLASVGGVVGTGSTSVLKTTAFAIEGGMVQMISHGFISAALFLCVGVLYDRVHSREISAYGGVVNTMPVFAALMVFFAMANAGLPGTSGFMGEFMVIVASMKANVWIGVIAATTLIIGASYTLWMVKRVVFGPVANDNVAQLTDIGVREFMILFTLAAAVLFFGLWPDTLTSLMHHSVSDLMNHIYGKVANHITG